MSGQRKVWWGDFATMDFQDIDPMETIALLPIAATEQHGPHLGCGTDATIARGMLKTLIPLLPGDLDLRILPIQSVGKSNEHLHAPGTLTIPATVLIDHWLALGQSVARAGIRKLVIVNSHGGNEEVMGIVARELRVTANMLVAKTSWSRFGKPDGLFSDVENRFGIHGGDAETSLILHFRPEAVDMEKAEDFPSVVAEDEENFALLRATGTHAYAWIASDLNPTGAVGEAAQATKEKGEALAAHQAQGLVTLLKDVRKAPLPGSR
ncbi:creatinine amidohydrolase [Rhizobium sp. PP-F2F-G38]|uniref:Creatininase family protein n=1 Tax=Ferranicluibacter rubi TaxID=2715133 RepID=A0AA44CFC7_9HYPH|nr:creatininase family protein [Ferranicluibacter rubi]PYE34028.1 creatinine amidohydrolase [Rhizobium sp. PP-WC-1G-195]PYE96664.1 creatinine amidohydrolase [Rhizobium sp. PP-F2F-G38]TCP86076.1 creatinine amidohydrolase [Rhizobium sp. PP-CC-2G-626]TCQ23651.1 creatinine amidohydrolase [Rhizobium sp. PP-CC-3G-465]NHT79082.1 creatininase family protein [Ferranicluibacter rubi]